MIARVIVVSLEDKIDKLICAIEKLSQNIERISSIRDIGYGSDGLIPLPRWNEVHQWPSLAAMRGIVFNKDYNGAKSFVRKIGRRVYIDEKRFLEWANSNPKTDIKKSLKSDFDT